MVLTEIDGFIRSSQGIKDVKIVVRNGIIYEVTKIDTTNGDYCDFDGNDSFACNAKRTSYDQD